MKLKLKNFKEFLNESNQETIYLGIYVDGMKLTGREFYVNRGGDSQKEIIVSNLNKRISGPNGTLHDIENFMKTTNTKDNNDRLPTPDDIGQFLSEVLKENPSIWDNSLLGTLGFKFVSSKGPRSSDNSDRFIVTVKGNVDEIQDAINKLNNELTIETEMNNYTTWITHSGGGGPYGGIWVDRNPVAINKIQLSLSISLKPGNERNKPIKPSIYNYMDREDEYPNYIKYNNNIYSLYTVVFPEDTKGDGVSIEVNRVSLNNSEVSKLLSKLKKQVSEYETGSDNYDDEWDIDELKKDIDLINSSSNKTLICTNGLPRYLDIDVMNIDDDGDLVKNSNYNTIDIPYDQLANFNSLKVIKDNVLNSSFKIRFGRFGSATKSLNVRNDNIDIIDLSNLSNITIN